MLRHWFFEMDASLRSMQFLGRELEYFHRFHWIFAFLLGSEVRARYWDIVYLRPGFGRGFEIALWAISMSERI